MLSRSNKMLITFERKHKVEIYSLIKQLLTLRFSLSSANKEQHAAEHLFPTQCTRQIQHKSINGDIRPPQLLLHNSSRTTETVRSLASIFICALDLSHRTIQLISVWEKYLIYGHHSCCSHDEQHPVFTSPELFDPTDLAILHRPKQTD